MGSEIDLLGTIIISKAKEETDRLIKEESQTREMKAGNKEVVWRKTNGVYKSYTRKTPAVQSNKFEKWNDKKRLFNKSFHQGLTDSTCYINIPDMNFKNVSDSKYLHKVIENAVKEWQNYYGITVRIIKK